MNIKQILQKLDEYLYETKEQAIHLYEMSQPQAKVRDKIRDLSKPIFKHLIKVVLYGKQERQSLHHWANELDNWLDQCMDDKIKKSGKDRYPNYDELLTWLTDYYNSSSDIERMRSNIEKEYFRQGHEKRTNISDEQVYNSCYNILKEACKYTIDNNCTDDIIINIFNEYILA